MEHRRGWSLTLVFAAVGLLALGVPLAGAGDAQVGPQHGITFVKGCDSPTSVGEKTQCNFGIVNDFDPDTLTITSITDVVHGAAGDDPSGNILSALDLTFSGNASCNQLQTQCTLPPGSRIDTATPFAFHTVTGDDADNANPLNDDATLTWQDTCSSEAQNCPTGNQENTSGSQTVINKLVSSTETAIHDAQHNVVTAVEAGSLVHDQVTVTGQPNMPTPTGNVTVDWFTNANCTGNPNSTSQPTALNNSGVADVTSFTKTPNAGGFAFLGHYAGDSNYGSSDGECEPLHVVDATISISPDAVNEVNHSHTFTVTVTENLGDGNGFVPAQGAPVSYTLTNSNGASETVDHNQSSCDGVTDSSGQCTIVFTSSTGGLVTGNASVSLVLQGVTVKRDTDPATSNIPAGPGGTGPAEKTFVDASISIAPDATNEVGAPHTFTVTVEKDLGDGNGFVPAEGEHANVTLADSNGAVHSLNAAASTCDDAGPNTDAQGQCTIVFTSSTAGKVTGNASVDMVIEGVNVSRDTNPGTQTGSGPDGSGPAVKTFVDANITITPPTATNAVGQSHTFTVTVQKNNGSGNGFVAASGEHVDFTLTDSNGADHTLDAAASTCDDSGANTDGQGQCTIVFTSDSAGQVTGNASVTLTIGGVSVSRDTSPSTAATAGPGGSGPAVKTFVDANITINPPQATNEVNAAHTMTVTVMKDLGDGEGFVAASGEHVDFTLADSNGADHTIDAGSSTCDDAGANTNGQGQCTIVFTSSSAGLVTANASVTMSTSPFDTLDPALTRSTSGDAGPGGSGPATKTFVDARIRINPPTATNPVGDPHTLTVDVAKDLGDGEGFVAASGEHVDFTLTDGNGASSTVDAGASTCDDAGANTDAQGTCTIVFTSDSAGEVVANASVTLTINGVTLTRSTSGDAGPGGSGPAVKTFVDASISISPDGTNEVNHTHTFTVTVTKDLGDGNGAVPAAGEHVIASLHDEFGAKAQPDSASTCGIEGPNTDANGQCTIIFTSPSTGVTIGNAEVTLTIDSVSLTRDTDTATTDVGHGPDGSGPATKHWVDANVSIGPGGNNPVGAPHTFTVTVNKDVGDGTGMHRANGEHVDFTLTDSGGSKATIDAGSSTCDNAGANTDTNGQCTIVFTSQTAGTTVGNANVTVRVNGASVSRDTSGNSGPGGSGPATKTWFAPPAPPPPELPRTGTNALDEIGLAMLLLIAGFAMASAGWVLRPAGAHASRPWRRRGRGD